MDLSVIPAKRGNLHQKLSKVEVKQLEKVFSRQEIRYVNNDFTIRYQGNWFQLLDKQPVLVRKKEKVMVEERITGEVFLSLRGKYLNYTVLPERPKKIIEAKIPALAGTKSSWKPATNHPWRRFNINPEKKEKVSSLP